jgi:hypothetical protein
LTSVHDIAAFVLDLYFTYEREHVAFGLLSLANFFHDYVLQFHSFTYKIGEQESITGPALEGGWHQWEWGDGKERG